jgi:hypothetical protein
VLILYLHDKPQPFILLASLALLLAAGPWLAVDAATAVPGAVTADNPIWSRGRLCPQV